MVANLQWQQNSGKHVCSYSNAVKNYWLPYLCFHIIFLILKLQVFCYTLICLQFLYSSVILNYDELTVKSTLFAHFCVCACESRGQPHVFSLGIGLSFEMGSLSLALSSPDRLDCLSMELQGFSCLCLTSAEIINHSITTSTVV